MQKRWHHMEVTICQWYSASGLQSKTKKQKTKTRKNNNTTYKKQNIKPHNPLWYERSGSDIVSKLRKWKPTQSAKGSRKSNKQPLWWHSEIDKILDRKTCRSEKLAERKDSSKPRPKAQSCNGHQNWVLQADSTRGKRSENGKASVKNSMLKQHWRFWQFYQQMEGNDRTKTTPDLEDTNRVRLKTNEEKGQALFGRFIDQSNQNNWEERKHVLSDLNRSAEHVHKVALTMNSQRRNSTKPLEEAERILHLVRIGFDIRTSRT